MKTLVIEGIGDIVSRAVAAAAEKLHIDIPDLKVIFTDKSETWTEDVREDRLATVKSVERWGAKFLDKSEPSQLDEYNALLNEHVEAVLIETPDRTHIELARHWLTGNCKWIYIEKPLTSHLALEEARRWVGEVQGNRRDYARLLAFDHYRARVHAQFRYADYIGSILSVIGQLKRFRFYFLEDHSGTDQKYIDAQRKRGRMFDDRNGPIENEGRVDALRYGLVLDLMPHVLSVLEYFGSPETVQVSSIRPGIYAGVDYEPGKRAGINNETFAAIEFSFEDNAGQQVVGEAYIGKGIRGSQLFADMGGNVKVLEVEAEMGRLVFDFQYNILFMGEGSEQLQPMFDLERDAYYYLLTDIFLRRYKGTQLGLSVEMATIILDKLAQMKSKIDPESLAVYDLGDGKGESFPPWLEELLAGGEKELPVIDF